MDQPNSGKSNKVRQSVWCGDCCFGRWRCRAPRNEYMLHRPSPRNSVTHRNSVSFVYVRFPYRHFSKRTAHPTANVCMSHQAKHRSTRAAYTISLVYIYPYISVRIVYSTLHTMLCDALVTCSCSLALHQMPFTLMDGISVAYCCPPCTFTTLQMDGMHVHRKPKLPHTIRPARSANIFRSFRFIFPFLAQLNFLACSSYFPRKVWLFQFLIREKSRYDLVNANRHNFAFICNRIFGAKIHWGTQRNSKC